MLFSFISTFFEMEIDNTCQILAEKTGVNDTNSIRILPIVFLSSNVFSSSSRYLSSRSLLLYLISFLCPYNYIIYVEKAEN